MIELSILFFALYLGAVITIGFISAKKETEEGFMIADRNMSGIQVPATMSAGFLMELRLQFISRMSISMEFLLRGYLSDLGSDSLY